MKLKTVRDADSRTESEVSTLNLVDSSFPET